ncbi:MAG: hypothetical protein LUD25_00530 [Coriobacteriaceae bacterium]|nr:hypothetical protein [Coriobacteriaceae bacterium]
MPGRVKKATRNASHPVKGLGVLFLCLLAFICVLVLITVAIHFIMS